VEEEEVVKERVKERTEKFKGGLGGGGEERKLRRNVED
jgi:hypothetical protein